MAHALEEQAVGVVAGDHRRRAEPAARAGRRVEELGHADEVLGCQLGAEQAHAVEPERGGELGDQRALADAGLAPHEHRARHGDVQEHVGQLRRGDRDGAMHGRSMLPPAR
jgi:hypothetical protein